MEVGARARVKAVGNGQRRMHRIRIVFYKVYNETIELQRKPMILKCVINIPIYTNL